MRSQRSRIRPARRGAFSRPRALEVGGPVLFRVDNWTPMTGALLDATASLTVTGIGFDRGDINSVAPSDSNPEGGGAFDSGAMLITPIDATSLTLDLTWDGSKATMIGHHTITFGNGVDPDVHVIFQVTPV